MKLLNRQNKIIVTYFLEMKIFLEIFFVLTVGENKGGGHSESDRRYNNGLRRMNGN